MPGPQFPLYAGGARMLEMFPVVPLAKGQALAIGLTSYDGGVFYGFNGDRDAMSDVDVLAGMVTEALDELLGHGRVVRGRLCGSTCRRPGRCCARWSTSGLLEPIGGTAFALTPKLRESYTSGDDEELEYAAMLEAARASLRLLAVEFGLGEDGVPARRVVVAADLDDVTLRPDLDDGAVRIAGPVPLEKVAAVHIDNVDAEYAVTQAAAAVDAADMGDLDAEFLIGEAEDHELAWYDPSEVAYLVRHDPS